MSVSINDLQPQPFTVKIKGQEIQSQPLQLKHALVLAKMGSIFQDPAKATGEQIESAQADITKVFNELMPDLVGVTLDMQMTMEIMTQVMNQIDPEDNKELEKHKIKLNADPKA
jgi:hypothetical protein